ncbi:hypothetical protein M9H77_16536 [Catharanthus roseus]|uniref:Uncharacterized protein n=1 Tax=Catharanthus roseus TaxID=4058 RepID=A0ACC0B2F2_CATRO|nr:hypothetical protein M9H77_16536 [Catharanthus roseus]
MHRSGIPHRCYSFGYDHMFRSVRGLHCTWLVPRTRASSDGVDVSDSGEWIHLKRSIDRRECGPIGLHGHRIMLCNGVDRLVESQERLETKINSGRIVPRGTQIPYSAAADLVAGLGVSQIGTKNGMRRQEASPRS